MSRDGLTGTMQTDLLIVGAGPAGLMAACWASQYQISFRIIDRNPTRKPTGHADGIHSRTIEILDSFGIADRITKLGVPDVEMCYWVGISLSFISRDKH